MQVVDGPLVEYYKSCIVDLRRSGFHVLMLALVRDADAPTFYDDLLRYWNSINDVTGRHVVFAVAGGLAAERVGVGAIHGQGYYSEHMALAEGRTFDISELRRMAGSRRNVERLLANVADANTAQISVLCDHLRISERDLPCLHLTHLETGKCVVIPITGALGTTVYTACKDIMSQLQFSIRSFEQASLAPDSSDLRMVQQKIKAANDQIVKLHRRNGEIGIALNIPNEVHDRDKLVSYFRVRLKERSEFTPAGIAAVADLCENRTRIAADYETGRTLVKRLGLIPRLDKKARRMLNAAFSERAIEFESTPQRQDTLERKRDAATQEVVGLENELRGLRAEEDQLALTQRTTISTQQRPARKAIEEAFEKLRPPVSAGLVEKNWDFFLSYAAPDRKKAIEVFKRLEDLGPTFIDVFCLLPGQDWQKFLPEIQARCRFTVPLLSKNAVAAHFQNSEIQRAINLMRQGTHIVFPIYLEDGVGPPFGLEQVHSLQYSQMLGGAAVGALRRSLDQLGYARAPNS